MKKTQMPAIGSYVDQLGHVMVRQRATDGAWQAAKPKTATGKYAKQLVAHRFAGRVGKVTALWDGTLDAKAMKALIELGKKEGLIVVGRDGRIKDVSRFLDELRPYQLDVPLAGAQELRCLMAKAGETREFFEISADWPSGEWSDVRANRMLRQRLAEKAPVPDPTFDHPPVVVGSGSGGIPDPTFDNPPVVVGSGSGGIPDPTFDNPR